MALRCDITFDVAVDVDMWSGRPQTFGIPPEEEGEFCGSLFFGETSALDDNVEYIPIPGPPGPPGQDGVFNSDASELPLGDELVTDGTSLWDSGAVTLTALDTVSVAISLINKRLALAATQADLDQIRDDLDALIAGLQAVDIPLGEDVATDGLSLWDGGAVVLNAGDTAGYAISRLNHVIEAIQDQLAGGVGAQDGFHLPLGDVVVDGDGSWSPGAVPLTDNTMVSEAVDRLNEVLGKLVPTAPPDFPNGTLTLTNGVGNSPRLCSGVTDNSGASTLSPGDAVSRITAAGFSSNTFNDVGPGESGGLNAYVNGAIVGSRNLTGSGDNGNYSGLVISDQKDYPVLTPGFWISVDVNLTLLAAPIGINNTQIVHTGAGSTNTVFFVRDGLTASPTVSNGAVSQQTAGTFAYSSGVPHYGTGGQLLVDAAMNNLSGETYYGGSDPFSISGTNSIFSTVAVTFAGLGIATPIPRNTTGVTDFDAQVVDVNGTNVHNSGQVQGTGRNVNGASAATTLSTTNILVKRGTAAGRIDENSISVSGLGSSPNNNNAVRKSGFTAVDKPAGSGAAWDSTAAIGNSDAAVVGGVLRNDQTNYSTGHLPVGPNYAIAGRNVSQYVTFSFNRAAVSVFRIAVTGTYTQCLIKLPGVTDNAGISPNAVNGWLDAFQAYDGAGVPGEAGDPNAGCAVGAVMTGASGTFQITFGTQSSTNSTGNEILVRFKLAPGQSITALSFTN